MSNDQITTTTNTSYGSRIKEALLGIVIGPVIVFFACTTLWSNEGRNANMLSALSEGRSSVQSARIDNIDPSLENALIHLTGDATTSDVLVDSDFGLSFTGIRLDRNVEMYQWKEKSESSSTDNYGGSQTTTKTYTYSKVWDNESIDSSSFHEKTGHENPTEWKYKPTQSTAQNVTIGSYNLSSPVIDMIPLSTVLSLVTHIPKTHTGEILTGDSIYIGIDPSNPKVGDMRVTYMTAENNSTLSLLGKQTGKMVSTYIAKSGSNITRVELGNKSSDELFQHAEDENTLITWIWRIGGLIFIFIGFSLFFRILPILAKVLPPLAWIVDAGVGLISLLLTIVLGGTIIILAWFTARPILSLIILGVVTVIGGGVYYLIHQKKKNITLSPSNPSVPE